MAGMGIKDDIHRHGSDDAEGDQPPVAEEVPGSVSSPRDVGGHGPVTLDDRTRTGGQGSPDTNQAKAEPMPPTPGGPDPTAALESPSLEEMNVGGADAQSPNHPAARDRQAPVAVPAQPVVEPGVAPADDRPAIDLDSTTTLPEGPEPPASVGPGTAQRAPGSLGVSPAQQETDVQTGAANMRPGGGPAATPSPVEAGDAQDVPVPHETPAAGTSEETQIAHGVRAPKPPEV